MRDGLRGRFSNVFGMDVRVAGELEWAQLVKEMQDAGAVEIGNSERTEHDIIIDDKARVIFVNPARGEEILQRLRAATTEEAS